MMASVEYRYVSKSFQPDRYALAGLTVEVADGEFLAVLGRSGSGKSTMLRLLTGLDDPDAGELFVDGRSLQGVPARDRKIGMVMQMPALVTHRNAGGNIRLPLEFAGTHADEIRDRLASEADELHIGHLLRRKPTQLSGGETQAVQLARALIARPRVLLLDEPLARIDHEVRSRLRADITRLQRKHHVTTIMATSDQADAMSLADRILVLDDGRLQQIGTPLEVYHHPINTAVARFLGEPGMNLLRMRVVDEGAVRAFRLGSVRLPAWADAAGRYVGADAIVGIRAEDVAIVGVGEGHSDVVVDRTEPFGAATIVRTRLGGQPVDIRHLRVPPRPGATIGLRFDPARVHLFDPYSEAAIHHPVGP